MYLSDEGIMRERTYVHLYGSGFHESALSHKSLVHASDVATWENRRSTRGSSNGNAAHPRDSKAGDARLGPLLTDGLATQKAQTVKLTSHRECDLHASFSSGGCQLRQSGRACSSFRLWMNSSEHAYGGPYRRRSSGARKSKKTRQQGKDVLLRRKELVGWITAPRCRQRLFVIADPRLPGLMCEKGKTQASISYHLQRTPLARRHSSRQK
jgi:hypothetical protein